MLYCGGSFCSGVSDSEKNLHKWRRPDAGWFRGYDFWRFLAWGLRWISFFRFGLVLLRGVCSPPLSPLPSLQKKDYIQTWSLTNYMIRFPIQTLTLSFTESGHAHWALPQIWLTGLQLFSHSRHASVMGRRVTDSFVELVVKFLAQFTDMWRLLQIVVPTLHVSQFLNSLRLIHLQSRRVKHIINPLLLPIMRQSRLRVTFDRGKF